MNFVTYNQLIDTIGKNIKKLPHEIDLIVGIPRSGMLAANLIALSMNLPFTDLDGFLNNRIIGTGDTRKRQDWVKTVSQANHVLVVDDSISKGDAIKKAKDEIGKMKFEGKISYCAIYALPSNTKNVDIYFEICNHPRMFEWNYMHHWMLEYACMDIDGVLCEDPSIFQNDDGKRYLDFLQTARPIVIPTKPVKNLVTCRLEKYRHETENWLNKHGVKYDNLVMLDCIDANGRNRISQGKFKGEFYKNSDCIIFIESNFEQALEICKISNKQVYCVDRHILINPNNLMAYLNIYRKDIGITIKRVIKKLAGKL